jgi:hypothetical protein
MLVLGERSYPMCLLDTNVVSEMVKDDTGALMRHYFEWALDGEAMLPCFSPFTLMELRRSTPVFKRFVERFAPWPSAMTKGYIDLMNDERDAYPDPSSVGLVAVAFLPPPFGQDGNRLQNLPWMMDQHTERLQEWHDAAPKILAGMRSLVRNYPPEAGRSYTPRQVHDFVWQVVFQQLALHDGTAEFTRECVEGGEVVDTDAFPSLRAMAFIAFCKLYTDPSRNAHASDVVDMLISAALPYVEAFITENHQAESLRKIRQHDFLEELEVFRLRDFRVRAPSRTQ